MTTKPGDTTSQRGEPGRKSPARELTELEKSERQAWLNMAVWLVAFLIAGIALAIIKYVGRH